MTSPHLNFSLKNMRTIVKGNIVVEKWVYISGYEGVYKISNFGRVKAMARDVIISYGAIRKHKLMIMKQSINRCGYLYILLPIKKTKVGKRYKYFTIHRLVGLAFIPNPLNKLCINHKKGKKIDNRYWMLEWNTQKENICHAFRSGLKINKPHAAWKDYIISQRKRSEIIKLRQSGLSFNKIYKTTGVSGTTASKICKENNIY